MAPHFLGEHHRVNCSSCRFNIVSEVIDPSKRSIVCPNCGSNVATAPNLQTQSAHQILLTTDQQPVRWQVVGFQRPNDNQASIKRVVGLPGETIWFEHGNIFLKTERGETQLLKKNWQQQKATRILVHDNRFQNQDSRWSPLESTSPLIATVPAQFRATEHRWLRYQPKRCYKHSANQTWSPRIEDSYGFNQSINRQLNTVNEVCLEFELDPDSNLNQTGQSELLIAIVVGQQTHLARFVIDHDSAEVQLFDRSAALTTTSRCQIDRDIPTCGISNIDQQIIVTVGNHQAHLIDLNSQDLDTPVELLLSLQPANLVDLKRLRLWRDTYYFSALSRDELLRRQANSTVEGYFLIGDNLPVSRDSRLWALPTVDAEHILGVVDIGQ